MSNFISGPMLIVKVGMLTTVSQGNVIVSEGANAGFNVVISHN